MPTPRGADASSERRRRYTTGRPRTHDVAAAADLPHRRGRPLARASHETPLDLTSGPRAVARRRVSVPGRPAVDPAESDNAGVSVRLHAGMNPPRPRRPLRDPSHDRHSDGASAIEVSYPQSGPVAWLTINRRKPRIVLNEAGRGWPCAGVYRFDGDANVLVLAGVGGRAVRAGSSRKELADTALTVLLLDFVSQYGGDIEVATPTIAAGQRRREPWWVRARAVLRPVRGRRHRTVRGHRGQGGQGYKPWVVPLPRLVSPRIAMRLLLICDPIDAGRAYQVGLLNAVAPSPRLAESGATTGRAHPRERTAVRAGRQEELCV